MAMNVDNMSSDQRVSGGISILIKGIGFAVCAPNIFVLFEVMKD